MNPEQLAKMAWCFVRRSGEHPRFPLVLHANGRIEGYQHANERSWTWVDGHIAFVSASGRHSTIFDRVISESPWVLEGDFLLDQGSNQVVHQLRELTQYPQRIEPVYFKRQTKWMLHAQIARYGWVVGDHTYGEPLVLEPSCAHLSIGRFTSIAGQVTVVLGNHRTDAGTLYPFKSLRRFWPTAGAVSADHDSKGDVVIGNDVWIGQGATILSGVRIGDGAVVGAQSVVSRDVPPYAIVAGNPARVIRHRFDQATVNRFLALRWWDWPQDQIEAAIPLLVAADLEPFWAAYG
jgi:hypothetical protein